MRIVLTVVGLSLVKDTLPKLLSQEARHLATELDLDSKSARRSVLRENDLNSLEKVMLRPRERRQWTGAQQQTLDALAAVQQALWCSLQASPVKRRFSCAELASLSLLDPILAPDDQVWLLASETSLSLFCAQVLQQVLQTPGDPSTLCRPGLHVDLQVLTGVQVLDPVRFQQEGMLSWAMLIERALQATRASDDRVILNITGGYKGFAPIATLLAFALSTAKKPIETVYLYEESDQLLKLPGSDLVRVDLSVFEQFSIDWKNLPPDGASLSPKDKLLSSNFKEQLIPQRPDLFTVSDDKAQLTATGRVMLAVWEARQGSRRVSTP